MPTLHVAMRDVLLIVRPSGARWSLEEHLAGTPLQCVAVDPADGRRIFVGTRDRGVWRSLDGGRSWELAGMSIGSASVTALAVGGSGDGRAVYAGTEPSAVFRSLDAGDTWQELDGFRRLPSAPTWITRSS